MLIKIIFFFLLLFNLYADSRDNTVLLPIEVLGKPGVIETIDVNFEKEPKDIRFLYLKIYNFNYENKVSVQPHDSSWIDLNSSNIELPAQQIAFHGIGGTFSTLDVTVRIPNRFDKDWSRINFRFNDTTNKLTIGYRILDIKFLDSKRNIVKTRTRFIEDDPARWPESTNKHLIIKGEQYWRHASLRDYGRWIKARCADCHAQDGADLKYFNYSNKSIIERSVFHEISREDARAIAAYIRSLNIPYEKDARPWNPPYQPAPGIDSKPVRSWSAGGGLKAVLTNDLHTLTYIFTNGIYPGVIKFSNTLNAREIPLAVQFPDWNKWLPKIHPIDAFPKLYPDGDFYQFYFTLRSNILVMTNGLQRTIYFNRQKNNWDRRAGEGLEEPSRSEKNNYAQYMYNLTGRNHWRVVKTWELMTEFGLEDYGKELFNSDNDRSWFHGEVFRLAPHMIGTPHYPAFYSDSMQWYQLQLVLNDGHRSNPSIVPIDWGYCHSLNLSSWKNPTNFITYGIMVLNIIKAGESVENGIPIEDQKGWIPHRQNINLLANRNYKKEYSWVDKTLRKNIAEALLYPWVLKAESYSLEQWQKSRFYDDDFKFLIMRQIPLFRDLGVDQNLVDRFKNIGRMLWPEEAWDTY